jgi:sulfate permease, SulP family
MSAGKKGFSVRSLVEPFGQLGLLAPLALGLMLFNGLNPPGIFLAAGSLLIVSGLVGRMALPVAPMSIVAAYAIATAVPTDRILAAGALAGVALVVIGVMGVFDKVRRWVDPAVIRGAEAAAGILLIPRGVELIAGTTVVQTLCHAAEPHLKIQSFGGVAAGIVIGVAGVVTMLLLSKKTRWPGGPIVIGAGMVLGLLLGTHDGLEKVRLGLHWPRWLPYGIPAPSDFASALVMLTLPQMPATLEEVAQLSRRGDVKVRRRLPSALCISAGLVNLFSVTVGGPPLGYSGGFPSRSRWYSVPLGGALVAMALLLGFHLVALIHLIPLAIVGGVLIMAGVRMALALAHLDSVRAALTAAIVCGLTWGSNLALGVAGGIMAAWLLPFFGQAGRDRPE